MTKRLQFNAFMIPWIRQEIKYGLPIWRRWLTCYLIFVSIFKNLIL